MKINSPSLHLIPAPIGEFIPVMPPWPNAKIVITENAKDARRALKLMYPDLNLQEIEWVETDRHKLDKNQIIDILTQAKSHHLAIGLMSDAGVPCVADPGSWVVKQAHLLNIPVYPYVGPSSILLALMGSGFNGQCFAFHGYLPVNENEKIKTLKKLEEESAQRNMTQIFIETPYRNEQLLASLLQNLKPDTYLALAANLQSSNQLIISKPVAQWKHPLASLHKIPTVFLIYRNSK